MNEKEKKYHTLYLDISLRMSEMSYAKRLKVGAILVKDDNITSHGWNGMPRGLDNCCEHEVQENVLITKLEVLHAEQNVISKAARSGVSTKDSTLYITHSPCIECSKLIQQSGINRVVYLEDYRDSSGVDLLKRCDIEVIKFTYENTI